MIEVEKQDEVKFFKEVRMSDLTVEKKMELIQSLPKEADDMVRAHLMDYETMPPTITEFLTDPFYAKEKGDHLFPFWWDVLKDFYVGDSRFYTSKFIFNTDCAVGGGKTNCASIILAYNLVRACCRRDWFAWNGIDTSPIAIFCFNNNLPKAEESFVRPFKYFLSQIPFLQEHKKRFGEKSLAKMTRVKAASQGNHSISEVCLGSELGELSSRKYDDAADCLNKVFQRISSRNVRSMNSDSTMVIDSQLLPGNTNVETWIKQSGNLDRTFKVTAPHWKIRTELYKPNSPESPWFYVYAGDDTRSAVVLPDDFNPKLNTDLTLDMEKVIHVPNELKSEFLGDIQLALCQKAAVTGTGGGNRFFSSPEVLVPHLTIPQEYDDVYKLDFYEDSDYTKIFLSKLLDTFSKEDRIYIHADPAFTNDRFGIAFGRCLKTGFIETSGKKMLKGLYEVPVAFAIQNKPGQENNIVAFVNLILELSKYRQIGKVTMDTHQSRQMKQQLLLAGINADILSMDRPAANYCLFKNLLLQGDVKLPKNSMLVSELIGLVRDEHGKIDHETSMKYFRFFSDGEFKYTDCFVKSSKDIADAVGAVICSMYNDGMEACATVEKEKKQNKAQLYSKLAERNRLKSIRGQFGFFG